MRRGRNACGADEKKEGQQNGERRAEPQKERGAKNNMKQNTDARGEQKRKNETTMKSPRQYGNSHDAGDREIMKDMSAVTIRP